MANKKEQNTSHHNQMLKTEAHSNSKEAEAEWTSLRQRSSSCRFASAFASTLSTPQPHINSIFRPQHHIPTTRQHIAPPWHHSHITISVQRYTERVFEFGKRCDRPIEGGNVNLRRNTSAISAMKESAEREWKSRGRRGRGRRRRTLWISLERVVDSEPNVLQPYTYTTL